MSTLPPMAMEGPLLVSVRRLVEELGDHIRDLPQIPLPVRLWWDDDDAELRLDLMITLGSENRVEQEQELGALSNRGLEDIGWHDRTVTGSARVVGLGELLDPEIDALVEAASIMRPTLDRSVPEAWQVPRVARGSYTGNGVIVGIIDSGVDLTHPSFRSQSGGTRVLHYWNQTLRRASSRQRYGAEWDQEAIDALLGQVQPTVPTIWLDPSGHGTRVAGIAGGNGQGAPGGRYLGVAPNVDLVVVALEARRTAFPSTNNVIEGIGYVFERARELEKRAVVNLSHGVQVGAHEPSDRLETALADLLAEGDERIVVVSSGNTGDANAHARVAITDGGSIDLPLIVPCHAGPLVFADIWYEAGDDLDVAIVHPNGESTRTAEDREFAFGSIGNARYETQGVANLPGVGANELQVKLFSPQQHGDVEEGRWTLRLHGRAITSESPIDVWLDCGFGLSSPHFTQSDAEADHTITAPATATGAVAVGSYAMSPTVGRLASYSGRGPDRTESPVEMLTAPGGPVTTAEPGLTGAVNFAPAYGTSFAAPHVTGAIALMLEAAPHLTRDEVIDCLRRSARSDAETSAGPASAWGAGKLDIAAALACLP